MESNSTAILIKIKLRHSLGRPSRSDFVQSEFTEIKDIDYIRDRKSNISFSLHDSRILQIEINEDKLSLNMDRIFQYTDNEEKWYKGIIEFTNIDKEECNIMVFNAPYGYNEVKSFSGKELSFDEF